MKLSNSPLKLRVSSSKVWIAVRRWQNETPLGDEIVIRTDHSEHSDTQN